MTPFDYVSVLISIILGLGITQIMTGLADLVHQWDRVKLYWPHFLWIILVFILHIQEWWVTYQQFSGMDTWRLATFLLFILYPMNLFILARILFPFQPPEGELDLKRFYFDNFQKFFLCTVVLNVLSIITNVMVNGFTPDQLIIVSLMIILGWVAWQRYTMEWLHKAIAAGLMVVMALSVIVNWEKWLIR
jgi:hypothetical protein